MHRKTQLTYKPIIILLILKIQTHTTKIKNTDNKIKEIPLKSDSSASVLINKSAANSSF